MMVSSNDFNPQRRLGQKGYARTRTEYAKPDETAPSPRIALPRSAPGFDACMEFLCSLTRAKLHGLASHRACMEVARSRWASSDTLLRDFGWTTDRLALLIDYALREHNVRVCQIFYPHHAKPRTYYAIADEHWSLAQAMLNDYWAATRTHVEK